MKGKRARRWISALLTASLVLGSATSSIASAEWEIPVAMESVSEAQNDPGQDIEPAETAAEQESTLAQAESAGETALDTADTADTAETDPQEAVSEKPQPVTAVNEEVTEEPWDDEDITEEAVESAEEKLADDAAIQVPITVQESFSGDAADGLTFRVRVYGGRNTDTGISRECDETLTMPANGSAQTSVPISAPGYYYYTIEQTAAYRGSVNVTDEYRQEVSYYDLQLSVEEKDGQLSIENWSCYSNDWNYVKNGSNAEELSQYSFVFTNSVIDPVSLTIPIQKQVNNLRKETTFTFTLDEAEDQVLTLASWTGGVSYRDRTPIPDETQVMITADPDDGTDDYTTEFGSIIYDAPGTYHYVITEEYTDGFEQDVTQYYLDVTVNREEESGELSVSWAIRQDSRWADPIASGSGDRTDALQFTNTYLAVDVNIPVQKVITSKDGVMPDEAEDFNFVLSPTEGSNAPVPEDTELMISTADRGEASFGTITFTEPGIYTYSVEERSDSGIAQLYDFDDAYYTIAIYVDYDNAANELTGKYSIYKESFTAGNTDIVTDAEIPDDGVISALTFENIYHSDAEPVHLEIPIQKTIEVVTAGDEDEAMEMAECETFEFVLEPVTLAAPLPDETIQTITGEGETSFEIDFYRPAVWMYKIYEKAGTSAGIEYDRREWNLTVTVTEDEDGVLSLETSVDGLSPDEDTLQLPFENVYYDESTWTSISIPVEKHIYEEDGQTEDKDGTFSFSIAADNFGDDTSEQAETPMPDTNSVTITTEGGQGSGEFEPIIYSAPGTYFYVITEERGINPSYDYDSSRWHIAVDVTRDPDTGMLRADSRVGNVENPTFFMGEAYGEGAVFSNSCYPTLQFILPIIKKMQGDKLPAAYDNDFTFTITQVRRSTNDGVVMPRKQTVTIPGGGTAKYDPIGFRQEGTFYFRVRENELAAHTGLFYDPTVYDIIVNVERDSETGEMQMHYRILKDGSLYEGTSLEFVNEYHAQDGEVSIEAKKVLTGRDLEAGMFRFVLKDASGAVVETVSNKQNGVLGFTPIVFTEPGQYTYTVSEEVGSDWSIEYDDTVYTVQVNAREEGGKMKAEYTAVSSDTGSEVSEMVFNNAVKPKSVTVVDKPGGNKPGKTDKPGKETEKETEAKKSDVPGTGDESPVIPLGLMALGSLLVLAWYGISTRRKRI